MREVTATTKHDPCALDGLPGQQSPDGPGRAGSPGRAHTDVVVELDQTCGDGRTRVEVEARLGTTLRPGDPIGVLLPGSGELWVIPPRDHSTVTDPKAATRATNRRAEWAGVMRAYPP